MFGIFITNDPMQLIIYNLSVFLIEITCYFCAALVAIHANDTIGFRNYFLIGGILCHVCFIEFTSAYDYELANVWNAQAIIMLLNRRLPLYIVLAYSVMYYMYVLLLYIYIYCEGIYVNKLL